MTSALSPSLPSPSSIWTDRFYVDFTQLPASSKTQCSSHTPQTEAPRMPYWHCFVMCTDTWGSRNSMYDCCSWTSRVHSTPSSRVWCSYVNSTVTPWIFSFLSNRPQRVRISNSIHLCLMKSGRTLVPHKVVCCHLYCLPSIHRIAHAAPRGYYK